MARKKAQPPGLQFTPFHWTPANLSDEAVIWPGEVSSLVNKIKDVASGAATVLNLIESHNEDMVSTGASYFDEHRIWLLNRLAMQALTMVNEEADRVVGRIHSAHSKTLTGAK